MDDYNDRGEEQVQEIMIVWKCHKCGQDRTDYEGFNEGGDCTCGGVFLKEAEVY